MSKRGKDILEKDEMTEKERAHIRGEVFTEINEIYPFKHKDLLDLVNVSGGENWLMESDIEKIRERLQDIGNSLNYMLKHLQAFQGLHKLDSKYVLKLALNALGFRGFPFTFQTMPPFETITAVPHKWLEKEKGMNKEQWERGI